MASKSHKIAQKFTNLLQRLGPEGMSDDESGFDEDDRSVSYKKSLVWRAAAVGEIMTYLDLLYLSGRYSSNGRPSKGGWPHTRLPGSTRDPNTTPVKGLPRNCYRPQWLQTLTAEEIKALKLRPPVDLSIPPSLVE